MLILLFLLLSPLASAATEYDGSGEAGFEIVNLESVQIYWCLGCQDEDVFYDIDWYPIELGPPADDILPE